MPVPPRPAPSPLPPLLPSNGKNIHRCPQRRLRPGRRSPATSRATVGRDTSSLTSLWDFLSPLCLEAGSSHHRREPTCAKTQPVTRSDGFFKSLRVSWTPHRASPWDVASRAERGAEPAGLFSGEWGGVRAPQPLCTCPCHGWAAGFPGLTPEPHSPTLQPGCPFSWPLLLPSLPFTCPLHLQCNPGSSFVGDFF